MKNQGLRMIGRLMLSAMILFLFCLFSSSAWADCQTYTAAIRMHVLTGRAFAHKTGTGCDASTYYYTTDPSASTEYPPITNFIGDDLSAECSVYSEDSGVSYHPGECPPDNDKDGYHAKIDCDDSNPAIHPGANEVCEDGVDQNCDGLELPCTPYICQEYTATMQEHEDTGRVRLMCTCDCWYILKGSDLEYDGISTDVVTLFTIDDGESFYLGTCP